MPLRPTLVLQDAAAAARSPVSPLPWPPPRVSPQRASPQPCGSLYHEWLQHQPGGSLPSAALRPAAPQAFLVISAHRLLGSSAAVCTSPPATLLKHLGLTTCLLAAVKRIAVFQTKLSFAPLSCGNCWYVFFYEQFLD